MQVPNLGILNIIIEEGEGQAEGQAGPCEGCDSSTSFCVMERGCELPPRGAAVQWANGHALPSEPLLWVSAGFIGSISSHALTVLCRPPPAVTYSRARWAWDWELLICPCKGEGQGARL